ncbi:tail fiber [Xanthomonas virus PB119]|nr:tail fiber [Xanthomonas virus PB119]
MKTRNQDTPSILLTQAVGLEGRFKIQKKKVGSDELIEVAPWQDNLITNYGLDQIGVRGSISQWMYALAVGSGSTPPAITDTGLVAKVAQAERSTASGTAVAGQTQAVPYYGWIRHTYEFAAGTAAGNLSELGLKYYTVDNLVHTRALIKDSSGNPTTITVLADEILIVTYEVRLYVDSTDKTYNETIKGVPTVITVRPSSLINNWFNNNGQLLFSDYVWGGYWYYGGTGLGVGPVTGVPSGTMDSFSNVQLGRPAYVAGSYTRNVVMRLTIANMAGRTITGAKGISGAVEFQIGFSPGFAKTDAETVDLTLGVSWGRYVP